VSARQEPILKRSGEDPLEQALFGEKRNMFGSNSDPFQEPCCRHFALLLPPFLMSDRSCTLLCIKNGVLQ